MNGLPRVRVELPRAPLDPRTLFPQTVGELRLEIGFGSGEHLLQCHTVAFEETCAQ